MIEPASSCRFCCIMHVTLSMIMSCKYSADCTVLECWTACMHGAATAAAITPIGCQLGLIMVCKLNSASKQVQSWCIAILPFVVLIVTDRSDSNWPSEAIVTISYTIMIHSEAIVTITYTNSPVTKYILYTVLMPAYEFWDRKWLWYVKQCTVWRYEAHCDRGKCNFCCKQFETVSDSWSSEICKGVHMWACTIKTMSHSIIHNLWKHLVNTRWPCSCLFLGG